MPVFLHLLVEFLRALLLYPLAREFEALGDSIATGMAEGVGRGIVGTFPIVLAASLLAAAGALALVLRNVRALRRSRTLELAQ